REHVSDCAASQWFDRLYFGGRPGHNVPNRIATRGLNMTENPVRSLVVLARYSSHFFVPLCCATLILEGCSARRRPDILWATAVMVRPVAQTSATEGNGVSDDPLPELRFELPAVPGRLIGIRPVPPRPRNGTASIATAGNGHEEPETPTVDRKLTTQESGDTKQQSDDT